MRLATSTLVALLLLAPWAPAQDGDNAPPSEPPAEEEKPEKPAPEAEGGDEAGAEEEKEPVLRVHPRALEILKKAEGLRYSPLKGGLKSMAARLTVESLMGSLDLDFDYDGAREGELADKIGMKLLTQVPIPEKQLIDQLKPQIQGLFFGSSLLESLDEVHLDFVEEGEDKGTVVMEVAKGPNVGSRISNTFNEESGALERVHREGASGGTMDQEFTYEKQGETLRIASMKITQASPMGMTQDVEIKVDHLACGDIALPWRVTVSQMMGQSTLTLSGVIVNGKPYANPDEAKKPEPETAEPGEAPEESGEGPPSEPDDDPANQPPSDDE